ncbi:hypothetical protein [Mucilaginibacter terrae]|nr:hypothetical protein [Mucilaginibacter terrae]
MEAQKLMPDNGVSASFFDSLGMLVEKYGLHLPMLAGKPYPYNILLAYENAEKQLAAMNPDLELFIVEENGCVLMAVKETAYLQTDLCYIPVMPLCRMIRKNNRRQSCELLLSVFSYLYHVVGIPYYREEGSFMACHYEMIKDWLEDEIGDMEENDACFSQSDLHAQEHYGDSLFRKMNHPVHLKWFEKRLEQANPTDTWDRKCLEISREAYTLWQAFPHSTLYSHVPHWKTFAETQMEGYPCGEDDDDNLIRLNEYIHFVADLNGYAWRSISSNINVEFNERPYWQYPTLMRVFNEIEYRNQDTLAYEHRLFLMLNDLCVLLTTIP